jgi:hypothetical protein
MEGFRAAERASRKKGLGFRGPDPTAPMSDTTVFVTRMGTKYHRAGCRALAKGATAMPLGEAIRRYEWCKLCDPPTAKD